LTLWFPLGCCETLRDADSDRLAEPVVRHLALVNQPAERLYANTKLDRRVIKCD